MTHQITVTTAVFKRLESLAKGFDTPDQVIERLLDSYEKTGDQDSNFISQKPNTPLPSPPLNLQLEIKYFPEDELEFKRLLLANKQAYVVIHKLNDSKEQKVWKALSFNENSSVKGNLLSGYLRGWRDKGIYKAEVAINKEDVCWS